MTNPYIKSANDLITKLEARRIGFIEYALRKNKESVPFIDRAKALKTHISSHCKKPHDIVDIPPIRESLLEAAGISVKAKAHLLEEDKLGILTEFVEKVLVPCGSGFVEEIVFRYLLTAGDALGGKMRNIIGAIAAEKFTRFIVSQLQVKGMRFKFLTSKGSGFVTDGKYEIDDAQRIKAIQWKNTEGEERHLTYNITVPLVRKNIDIVLLSKNVVGIPAKDRKKILSVHEHYACMGELKGGIDPAGADEHWKTASTALQRVRTAFDGTRLPLIFVGAAIEVAMASEIYNQYRSGLLSNCANLTDDEQLSSLCDWLTSV